MSKFCGNCGAQMDDNALVCGYCGAAFNGTSGDAFKFEDPEKKAKIKKMFKKIAAAVIALVIVFAAVNIVSSFTGYRGAIRKFMNAYKNENPVAMLYMSCSFIRYEGYSDVVAYRYEDRLEDDFDSFDRHFDSKYSIKYEITSASKLSERQSKNMMEMMAENGLISEDYVESIKKIMNVKVDITAKHGSDMTARSRLIYLAKEDGSWKLLYFE